VTFGLGVPGGRNGRGANQTPEEITRSPKAPVSFAAGRQTPVNIGTTGAIAR